MIPHFALRAHGEVSVVIFDSRIDAWHMPGGMVYRYTEHKTDSVVRFAKAFAPKRTGHLAGSVRRDVRRTSRDRVVGRVRATAFYSTYVIKGTSTPIFPKNGKWLSLPRTAAHPWNTNIRTLKPFVRGQAPNNFLLRALAPGMAATYPTPLGPPNPFV